MAETVEKVAEPGCLVDEKTFRDLHKQVCDNTAALSSLGPDLDEQTLATTVAGGVTTQITISNGNTIDIQHPEHICPEVMTRGQLLALRNAGNLDMSCHYLITKSGNGCLGDVVIELHPVDVDKLSTQANIHTTHDVEAWQGRYDITSNTIEELKDDRGNQVSGTTQTEVNAFPWGNTRWTDVIVRHATVQTECDTQLTVTETTFETSSTTDLRGATGFIRASKFGEDSIVQFNAAAISVTATTLNSRARIYGNGSTAVTLTYLHMDSEAYWTFAGRNDVRAIYSRMGSTSRVYFTAGDRQWFYYTSLDSYAHVRQLAGTIQMYYSNLDSYGEFRNEAGAGVAFIYGLNVSSRGYVRNYNTNRIRLYYNTVDSRGEIQFRDAADAILYYSNISGYAILTMQGTATIVYGQELNSNARLTVNGGNHYRNRQSSYSRIITAFNTRNIYADGSFTQTLSAANSNTYRGFGISTLV